MSKSQNFKVAITTTSFAKYDKEPIALLKSNGFEVLFNPHNRKLKKDEIIELCKGSVGIIAGTEIYDAEVLKILAQPSSLGSQASLRVISRCGTGIDNIDLESAKNLGIKVFNTPDAPTLAVAELTIGLILNLLRKVNQMDRAIRNNKWEKLMGNLLSEKVVGIIGFGKIGRKVAELLKSFNCNIRFYDINYEELTLKNMDYVYADLYELLSACDIITIHVSTDNKILGQEEISKMKKGACLINMARGGVVDEMALYEALKDGHIAGAALDVFSHEPYSGPLSELDNVILTPHIGSYAKEARIKMEMQAVENLLKGLKNLVING